MPPGYRDLSLKTEKDDKILTLGGEREQARRELRDLLRKTRDYTPSARLAAVIAWAGDDLEQMTQLLPFPSAPGGKIRIEGGWGGCAYSLDDCPYDWCAVHDEDLDEVLAAYERGTKGVTRRPAVHYCAPACVVGHERLGERCGG